MRSKRILKVLLACSILIGLSGCVFLPVEEDQIRPPLLSQSTNTYETEPIRIQTMYATRRVSAYCGYKNTYTANTGESYGNFELLNVRVGQQVKEGDVLYQMASNELEIQRDNYYSAYLNAEVNYRNAVRTYGEGSPEAEAAQFDIRWLWNAYTSYEKACANKVVYAPFDGTVIWINPNMRQNGFCDKWQDVIQIVKDDEMILTYTGTAYHLLEEGKTYQGNYRAADGTMTPYEVKVTYNEGNYKTQAGNVSSYRVEMELADPTARLAEGCYVDMDIVTEQHSDVLVVPPTAINMTNGTTYIRVLRGDDVVEVYVTVGLQNTQAVEIIDPSIELVEGDMVVVR